LLSRVVDQSEGSAGGFAFRSGLDRIFRASTSAAKISTRSKVPVKTRKHAAMSTPGVGASVRAIHEDKEKSFAFHDAGQPVAVVATAPPSSVWATSDPRRPWPVMEARHAPQ